MPRLDFRCAVQRVRARSRALERPPLLSSSFLAFFFLLLLLRLSSFAQKARGKSRPFV
jgi:hypothetical protein